jgi:AmmeMemoRadiSam system protein A
MLADKHRTVLLETAWQSIKHGVTTGKALDPDTQRCEAPLAEPGASFVTLHRGGELRGCIGSLEAYRALITDVAENAFAAAFRDPRFAPLQAQELADLSLDISVLSRPQRMSFTSEQELLTQLRPKQDGLILQAGSNRATFLPSVWESLPEPARFLRQLKLKAGLTADYWSEDIRAWRYGSECFTDDSGRATHNDTS